MIGLCIKHEHENYGGILQAYATATFFENQGISYELIRYTKKKTLVESLCDLPRLANRVWLNSRYEGVQRKISLKLHPGYARNNKIRMQSFAEFKNWAFHNFSEEYVGYAALCDGSKKYSAMITGSDQLWSPAGLPTNFFNLMFVHDDVLRISVASSFGVKEIPWYQKKRTKQYLDRIPYISMRENRGSEIVEELTGRRVPVVLDPVFYLGKEEWLERIPNEDTVNEPYVLAYFLGFNPEFRKEVTRFAAAKGLKVVALRHMDQYVQQDEQFGDIAPYDVDPRRFLNLIRNAQYVFTDSFHGTAFSIMHQKQFVVFNRYRDGAVYSKNSRIDTLCRNFSVEERRFCNGSSLEEITRQDIDYTRVEEKLEEQRIATNAYLELILEQINQREGNIK